MLRPIIYPRRRNAGHNAQDKQPGEDNPGHKGDRRRGENKETQGVGKIGCMNRSWSRGGSHCGIVVYSCIVKSVTQIHHYEW